MVLLLWYYYGIGVTIYLPWYLLQMINLPTTHPDAHEYLADGNFSTQIGIDKQFACIPMDQRIWKTINKDTQTPGGAKRFSTKKGTVSRYYITADYRAYCIRQLRYMAYMAFDIQIWHHLGLQKTKKTLNCLIDCLKTFGLVYLWRKH